MKQVKFFLHSRMLATILGLFLCVGAYAQMTVKGHVKDATTGEEIIGATVRVVGQEGGTITDYDGNFSIQAPQGSQITVSYIGYMTQTLKAAPSLSIILREDTKLLDDVVVIGYGTVKKNDLTGSVVAIKPDEMSKGITNNASDLLVGKVAGLDVVAGDGTPGGGSQMRIRGGSSLNASNDPLIVIDGMVIDNNNATGLTNILATINPSDIETMSVLKDASATAIYGSRASNGVIMIVTKKGSKGAPKLTYNGNITLSTTRKRYDMLDANEFKGLVGNLLGSDGLALLGNADTDWQDEIFRTSVSSDHNVSLTGTLGFMPYRLSFGFNDNNGIIKTSYMKRTNVGLNLSPKFLDEHLAVNLSAKYTNERNRYVDQGALIYNAVTFDPTQPIYTDSYTNNTAFQGYTQYIGTVLSEGDKWTGPANINTAPQNPVALLNQTRIYAAANDITGNIDVEYNVHGFEDLKFHGNLGGQYTQSKQHNDNLPYSFNSNYYGWAGITEYYKYSLYGNLYAQYSHDFENMHLDAMIGTEESHYHRTGYNGYGSGFDYNTGAPYNITEKADQEWGTHNTLFSYFGRLNYSAFDRYLLTFTLRRDGSSRFAKGHRWGTFPSVALAWKINKESFLKDVEAINDLKLRLGYGITGQQDFNQDFLYTSVYTNSNPYAMYYIGNTPYITTRPSKYNPDLTWEKTTTWNAGLDFAFLQNRITASIDLYYRKTKDLLNTVTIPVGTNFGSDIMKNTGDLTNKGIEFSINAKPVVTKDFTWDVSYNISWNRNKITSLNSEGTSNYLKTGGNISKGNGSQIMVNMIGQKANSFFVYQQVYDNNGKPIEGLYVDRNGDGQINESDKYAYKSPAADVIMGLTNKFIYKNWDFSFNMHASLGNYVYYDFLSNHGAVSESGVYYNSSFHNTMPDAVRLGFTGTTQNEYFYSDYFVRNASYLKISSITLGYSFAPLFATGSYKGIPGRLYCTVQNPFIFTKYDGLDPEISSGIDANPYPRAISVQLGVTLNF